MKRNPLCTLVLAALAAACIPAAWAQSHGGGHAAHEPAPDMHAMMKNDDEKMAAVSPSGDVDVDFARMMRIHHQGALDMAEHELRHGKDPQMQRLARQIIASQKKEIAIFDRYLKR